MRFSFYPNLIFANFFRQLLLNLKNNNRLEPSYLRILGLNTKANDLSKALKEHCTLPLISKMADSKKQLSEDAFTLLKEDIFASDLYNIVLSHKFEKDFVSDYQKQIQIL